MLWRGAQSDCRWGQRSEGSGCQVTSGRLSTDPGVTPGHPPAPSSVTHGSNPGFPMVPTRVWGGPECMGPPSPRQGCPHRGPGVETRGATARPQHRSPAWVVRPSVARPRLRPRLPGGRSARPMSGELLSEAASRGWGSAGDGGHDGALLRGLRRRGGECRPSGDPSPCRETGGRGVAPVLSPTGRSSARRREPLPGGRVGTLWAPNCWVPGAPGPRPPSAGPGGCLARLRGSESQRRNAARWGSGSPFLLVTWQRCPEQVPRAPVHGRWARGGSGVSRRSGLRNEPQLVLQVPGSAGPRGRTCVGGGGGGRALRVSAEPRGRVLTLVARPQRLASSCPLVVRESSRLLQLPPPPTDPDPPLTLPSGAPELLLRGPARRGRGAEPVPGLRLSRRPKTRSSDPAARLCTPPGALGRGWDPTGSSPPGRAALGLLGPSVSPSVTLPLRSSVCLSGTLPTLLRSRPPNQAWKKSDSSSLQAAAPVRR